MHRTNFFIVSGADLEYNKKILLQFHAEWFYIGVYRLKRKEVEDKKRKKKSARLSDKTNSWMECIQIIMHAYLVFRCKTLKI